MKGVEERMRGGEGESRRGGEKERRRKGEEERRGGVLGHAGSGNPGRRPRVPASSDNIRI